MRTKTLLTILLLILALSEVNSQKIKTYRAWATLTDDTRVKGILYSANEDGLILMDKNLIDTVAFLKHTAINILKVRKKGNVGKGALFGAAGGAVLGAILGYSDGDDPPDCWLLCATAEEKALMGGVVLAVPGTGIGALIGTGKKKYNLDGDTNTYLSVLTEIRRYALR